MSFNFNWSPLIADTTRARDLLTNALNKSPKPPIIVDDIIVSELNLGSTPPDLEILEIGDLAEDRFRGIFKMSYRGDAFLTLRTSVQANPLNTWEKGKPSWTSPGTAAAGSGLTIPIAISLSDIRLSGFVILVFSKNKGMTLVFRNDPLESLKVSSTFDSIPFVRDYLQREIEKQLRNLFMEDLPAILHRLSLRLWSPEYREMDDRLMQKEKQDANTQPVDPLASPPQDPVDWTGENVPLFSLDPSEYHASFSQKNLLRLAALNDSQKTLSLFTPRVRDAVFRAWAGASERGVSGMQTQAHTSVATLSRAASYLGSAASTSSMLSDPVTEASGRASTTYTFSGTSSRYTGRPRKAKKRVIDLRKPPTSSPSDMPDSIADMSTPEVSVAPSSAPSVIYEERAEDQLQTPPRSPLLRHRRSHRASSLDDTPRAALFQAAVDRSPKSKMDKRGKKDKQDNETSRSDLPPAYSPPSTHPLPQPQNQASDLADRRARRPLSLHQASASTHLLRTLSSDKFALPHPSHPHSHSHSHSHGYSYSYASPSTPGSHSHPHAPTAFGPPSSTSSSTSSYSSSTVGTGGILEQAWLQKIARDIARKVDEQSRRKSRSRSRARARSRSRSAAPGKMDEKGGGRSWGRRAPREELPAYEPMS